jgi:uncharacterized protein YkwD
MYPLGLSRILASFIFLPIFFSFTNPSTNTSGKFVHIYPTEEVSNMAQDILGYINQHRQSLGLSALKLSDIESDQANLHSQNMASGKIPFSHDGFKKRIKTISQKMGFVSASGENVAYGIMTAKEVVDTWLQSPEHRKNIEGNYLLTGIGVAKNRRGVYYFTEIFTK